MKVTEYIKSRGLTPKLVSQKLGITRQCLAQYGSDRIPTARTLEKTAKAMTELGAPTTVVDLVSAIYEGNDNEST